jgi:tetratricopeptide (TPR) repeat protein
MRDGHLSSERIMALSRGDLSPAESAEVADHLFQCAPCWEFATDALSTLDMCSRPDRTNRELALLVDTDPALAGLVQRFRLEQARLEQRLTAQSALGELKGMTRKQRREEISRRRAFRHREVVEELLAESRRSMPLEAEEWAALGITLSRQLSTLDFSEIARSDLIAECFVELASARRRSARWKAARQALKEGREHARRGSANRAIEGNLLFYEGVINGDIGSLDDAEAFLLKAKDCFEEAGEGRLVAKAWAQLGYIWIDADPERSLRYLKNARSLILPDDRKLFLLCEINRMDCLLTLGHRRQALRRFVDATALSEQFGDPFVQLRMRFLAGRLLESFEKYDEADAIFLEVIAADLERRSTKALYLDLVYLFGSYIRRSDLLSAASVCDDALQQLEVLELDESSERQMRHLWEGLKDSAQSGAVGLALLERSRHYIRSQWNLSGGDPMAAKESAV